MLYGKHYSKYYKYYIPLNPYNIISDIIPTL